MDLLSRIQCPADLRALPESALPDLALEIRSLLIETVSRTGGHLGPNLGVVELTIALHRVFDSPHDAVVWDTGHQAYVHKMLTGRWAALDSLRQEGGLSGYPSRSESAHDIVENSHASTALSYADGLAKAFAIGGRPDRAVVAVVGDGSLTGGMAWEALNNIGAAPHRPLVVVLNDNGRSYAPTAGAVGRHLASLRDGAAASVFEQLGLAYLGPVDGHDTAALEVALRKARTLGTPTVVHCLTRKGLGHAPAEQDEADRMHTVGPAGPPSTSQSWTSVFSDEMVALGASRPDVVAISAAMLGPTGLQAFADRYPDRAFDVGIAEQHAVTSAAGLATGGLHPVVCVYSTFLNRALDQVLMDVALHRLPVTFVLDRAGITGSDGPSHHGMWDLSVLGMVPGMRVAAPRDGDQLRLLLREAVAHRGGPAALRFPKADVGPALAAVGRLGSADVLRWGLAGAQRSASAPGGTWQSGSGLDGASGWRVSGQIPASGCAGRPDPTPDGVLLLAVGPLGAAAVAAADRLDVPVTVADPRWLLPVDPELVAAAAAYRLVVTVEDGGAHGGYGDAVSRALRSAGVHVPVRSLALPQHFLAHGSRGAILKARGLDAESIAGAVRRERPLIE
ncbi:1-deoxy-D-xylulose-5-phosphate synthase [Asanoa ishikariensis]|uniref:1-deoxy-D-xylulose-5-phosphate synthase n=1 Tax=Asanoa ishikariensis TaxID=137265 RepID=A0A1H3NK00_9ACTN|nr:1-deoxy-D-xylulose-5-phosphate synthase [Asanoa ishikariensis]GIF68562.1 1-deoxy-D-xylulose-5-phosphate synthase [Asanoa ishikariensis]SDY89256.1 1-deoxy-D-xylulose-5-phosphate synthase [Asanoa ishikariensis]